MLDAVKRLLFRESEVQPLVVVIEDLHWIDTETQTLLDSLVDALPAARILFLINYRPEYQHGWGSKTSYQQLRIDPLPAERADELLEALLGADTTLNPLKRPLIERTEANPLFLEEKSVRTLVETGGLAGERGAYRLTRPVEHLQIPATVQAILAARIDRLAPETKRLLQAAAVIGNDVPMPLLLAIADAPGPRCAPRWSGSRPRSSSTRRASFRTSSTRSSTHSPTRSRTSGCSTTAGARSTPASPTSSSGSRPSASLSRRSGWPTTRWAGSSGRRRSPPPPGGAPRHGAGRPPRGHRPPGTGPRDPPPSCPRPERRPS